MKIKRAPAVVVSGAMGLVLLVGLAGCGSLPKHYSNKTIPEDNLVVLQNGGPHANTWVTEDIIFDYRYTRSGEQLKISGTIDFDGSLKYNYDTLNYFDLWIYFTNTENKIIGQLRISPKTPFNELEASAFEKTFTLSPDMKAMVFSYRGSASEGGGSNSVRTGDSGSTWTFWKSPLG